MKIRALTIFAPFPEECSKGSIAELFDEALVRLGEVRDYLKNNGYDVWTMRVSLPKPPIDVYKHLPSLLPDPPRNILVSVGGLEIMAASPKLVADLAEKGYYVPLHGLTRSPLEASRTASRIVHEASSRDPVLATRVGVAIHNEPIRTPYFPDSTSYAMGWSFGLGYLYNDLMEKHIRKELRFEDFVDMLERPLSLVRSMGYTVFADLSLSPWMNDSTAKLIMSISKTGLFEPGFLSAIRFVNKIISELAAHIAWVTGFNEVMLPYAEDKVLIDAGCQGRIRAQDFLLGSTVCMAGPDMLVVPADRDQLANFILDTYTVWLTKKRPMGIRVIPVNGSPGSKVRLGKFGSPCIIPYR
ncbi:MAG: DUF711 family protein [Crenarchaeota archaeon]|nr:DUF711 family protein [Thermoproteota archaeon]